MRHAVHISIILLIPLTLASAAEERGVKAYLVSPTAVEEIEALKNLISVVPIQKSKWLQHRSSTITYVITQYTIEMFESDPCERLPIRVSVSRGKLQSATYAASSGDCKIGQKAPRTMSTGSPRLFTPDELFERLEKAQSQLDCYAKGSFCTALYASFDEQLGLPTKIADYSRNIADYYWSLEIKDIKVVP